MLSEPSSFSLAPIPNKNILASNENMTLHVDDLSFAAASDAARFAKYVMEMMSRLT